MRKKTGFTLIETLVTLALTSVAVMSITVIIFNSLQANNKINYLEKVDRNGSAVLEEIKKNLYKADATTIDCGGGQSTVTFTNKYDGVTKNCRFCMLLDSCLRCEIVFQENPESAPGVSRETSSIVKTWRFSKGIKSSILPRKTSKFNLRATVP